MRTIALVILSLCILGAVVSCEVSVWQECRGDHSWYYCWRILESR